jgi:hypothetical protein
MKRLFAAAALAAVAVLPASQAGAVPPEATGFPAGNNACFVIATPALPGKCNFTGASGGIGYGGISSGGATLTHVKKVNVCTVDPADGKSKVSGYAAQVVTDATAEGQSPIDFEDGPSYSFATGRVYTFTVNGVGFGAVGGQSSPGAAEPATPSAGNSFAGAENASSPIGTLC